MNEEEVPEWIKEHWEKNLAYIREQEERFDRHLSYHPDFRDFEALTERVKKLEKKIKKLEKELKEIA